jgi:hypothetical protein
MIQKLFNLRKRLFLSIGSLLVIMLFTSGCCVPCSPDMSIATQPSKISKAAILESVEYRTLDSLEYRLLEQLQEDYVSSLDVVKMNESPEKLGISPDIKELPRVVEPITVGAVQITLKEILSDLDATLRNAAGEIKAIGAQLQANLQNVLTDFDDILGDKLQYTFDRLKETELRFIEDVQTVIKQAERFVKLTTEGLQELAYITAAEADILAYNTLYALPCRHHIPRLVCTAPRKLQLEKHKIEYYFKLRGNFLNYGDPKIHLEDKPIDLLSLTANEISVRVPAELFKNVNTEKAFKIACLLYKCESKASKARVSKMNREQSLSFIVSPPVEYSMNVKIAPKAKLPTYQKMTFPYYKKDNNCKANYSIDKQWCLPSGWEVVDFRHEVTTANCGSQINAVRASGKRCVLVEAHLQGCGTNWLGSCKGRGWLGYKLFVNGRKYLWRGLPIYTKSHAVENPDQRTFSFSYPHQIPADHKGVKWLYEVKLTIKIGDRVVPIFLNETNPNHEEVTTRMSDEGRLVIELSDRVNVT